MTATEMEFVAVLDVRKPLTFRRQGCATLLEAKRYIQGELGKLGKKKKRDVYIYVQNVNTGQTVHEERCNEL